MNTKRELNAAKWGRLVALYERGGQGLDEFCRTHGINKQTLYYWRSKAREGKVEKDPVGFVRIKPQAIPSSGGTIRIRYKTGTEVELPRDYGLGNLERLIKLGVC